MSNGSEYISSTHPPVQLHSNVPKPSTLPYQLVKQHSSKSACLIRCIRSNKYGPSLIYKAEIRGAVYTYNYTATGVMNGSHSGLTHKSLHLEVHSGIMGRPSPSYLKQVTNQTGVNNQVIFSDQFLVNTRQ